MERQRITFGSPFEEKAGYSRAIVDGDWVFVSGTVGYDVETGTMSEDVVDQAEQAFRNIDRALRAGGATTGDMVRVRIFVASREEFERAVPVIKRWCDGARPANTTVIADLVEERMRIEIEVTAKRRARPPRGPEA